MKTSSQGSKIWNPQNKITFVGLIVGFLLYGLTIQDPNGSLAWLGKLNSFMPLLVGFFASLGYSIGFKNGVKQDQVREI